MLPARAAALLLALLFAPRQSVIDDPPPRGFTAASARAERGWEAKFQAIPEPDSLRSYMRLLSARPHHLGSARDSANAAWILDRFRG